MAHKTHPSRRGHHDGGQHATAGLMPTDLACKHDEAEMEAIRHEAFILWEKAGKPEGRCLEFWLEAEKDLALSHH